VICGVDEAGKGAVLGPLVVAAVGCRSEKELCGLGIRDSKELSRLQRERLYSVINDRFETAVTIIPASEIDSIRREMTLNVRIGLAHAEVIDRLRPETAIVDACDVNAERYGRQVAGHLGCSCSVQSFHNADKTYEVVGAASIIAKVTRDRAIDRLKEEHGEIGSGYPSDPTTITFLQEFIARHRRSPPFARSSWKTVSTLLDERFQQKISSF
jgi:ribonuclease HII